MNRNTAKSSGWMVYMVRCSDRSLYTGITTDLTRRIREHNETPAKGARYTRARRPVELVMAEPATDRQSASQREATLKRLSKKAKERLVNQHQALDDPK